MQKSTLKSNANIKWSGTLTGKRVNKGIGKESIVEQVNEVNKSTIEKTSAVVSMESEAMDVMSELSVGHDDVKDTSKIDTPLVTTHATTLSTLGSILSKSNEDNFEEQASALLKIIQRDINQISDQQIGVRRQSLGRLQSFLFGKVTRPHDLVLSALFPHFLKPLLKRFADPSENCRELALDITLSFMDVVSDLGLCLPYLIPAIME
jgi:hypothetical protein